VRTPGHCRVRSPRDRPRDARVATATASDQTIIGLAPPAKRLEIPTTPPARFRAKSAPVADPLKWNRRSPLSSSAGPKASSSCPRDQGVLSCSGRSPGPGSGISLHAAQADGAKRGVGLPIAAAVQAEAAGLATGGRYRSDAQSAANDASVTSRSGLSQAVIISASATSPPPPNWALSSGAASRVNWSIVV
jgi:hypothetical protein